MKEQLHFTVSEFLSSDNTNLEYSEQQIQGIMLSQERTNKYLNCILSSRGKKKPPTTKHQAAETLEEDIDCKLCTDSQASETFDKRIQVGSIA